MSEDLGQALEWDGVLEEVPDNEFEPVTPGDYEFVVESVERGQFNGSDKMGPCPTAKVRIRLVNESRQAVLFSNLMLNTKAAWRLGQFFVSVGMRDKHATKKTPLNLDWPGSIGRHGMCHVKNREYNGKIYNDVDFLAPKDAPAPAQAPTIQPIAQQVAQPVQQPTISTELKNAQTMVQTAFPGTTTTPMTPGAF